MKTYYLLLLVPMLTLAANGASIYKWVDEKGVIHYSESPPPGQKTKELQVRPPALEGSKEGSKAKTKTWQEKEQEFRQRHVERAEAEAKENARKKLESAEREANCKKANDERSRLLALKPRLKPRVEVFVVDPETDKDVETMNNAERSIRIKIAEDDIKKWCD